MEAILKVRCHSANAAVYIKQVDVFLGFKIANVCQQVLKPLGSYTRVFTLSHKPEKDG